MRPPLNTVKCFKCGKYGHYPSACKTGQPDQVQVNTYEEYEDRNNLDKEFDSLFAASFDWSPTKKKPTMCVQTEDYVTSWVETSKEEEEISFEANMVDCQESLFSGENQVASFEQHQEKEILFQDEDNKDNSLPDLVPRAAVRSREMAPPR